MPNNGRCRMHGGTNTGAPKGERNGAYRHGLLTAAAIGQRRELRELIKESRDMLARLPGEVKCLDRE